MSKLTRSGALCMAACFALPLAASAQNAPAQDAAGVVTGTATYRERMAMPKNAVFEATLEDRSRMDAPAEVIGKAVMENPGNPPYHFSISYDPRRIVDHHTYVVRATIQIGEHLAFRSDASYPVITHGNGKEVNILLKSASGRPAPVGAAEPGRGASLENTNWNLTRLADKDVAASDGQRIPYIFLDPAGNRLSGTYRLDKQTIRFGPTGLTMMACPTGMDREKDFVEALGETRKWKIQANELEFYDQDGKSLLRFEAAEAK